MDSKLNQDVDIGSLEDQNVLISSKIVNLGSLTQ